LVEEGPDSFFGPFLLAEYDFLHSPEFGDYEIVSNQVAGVSSHPHSASHNGNPLPALEASMSPEILVQVNGKSYESQVEPRMLLVHYLRDLLGLTGTHVGCETSICGACTVLLDGKAVKSCTVLAVQASGSEVTTIEGLSATAPANGNGLHPVQEGFWEKHGLQCGFCTPGMILASVELLRTNTSPSQTEIRHAISGNLCRCTGYQHIVQAVEYAAKKMKSRRR
jgi:carbon-monoxide dehydrogenase small subunit